MNRKAWLAIVMVLCLSFPALAQKITVSGVVYDAEGEPAIGATVALEASLPPVSPLISTVTMKSR